MTSEETIRIAKLAHIDLSETEVERLTRELSKILEYIDQLQNAPLDAGRQAEPGAPTPLREDQPRPSLTLAEASANAPDFGEGFFLVPAVLGGEE